MRRRTAIDAGPLVALFDRDDRHHGSATAFLRSCTDRFLTTLAVVTEVAYLLDFSPEARLDFLRWLAGGAVELVQVTADDLSRTADLVEKYADLPADFADASLLAVCERLGVRHVATYDADFSVYRLRDGRTLRNRVT